jgi:hypothetical protein
MPVDELIERFRNQTVESEDGDELGIETYPPATDQELSELDRQLGRPLAGSFRNFLKITNGMQFFGEEVLSCRRGPPFECASLVGYEEFLRARLVPFHAWGNGDFDALDVGAESGDAPVVFCNHSPEIRVRIADSFEQWLERACDEMRKEGALLHPSDFMQAGRSGSPGIYAHVPGALKNVDCELWATFGGGDSGGGEPAGDDGAHQPPGAGKKPWWKFW